LEAGQLVGNRYRIERLIGRGSKSAVYEGSDVQSNRRIALKVLDPVLSRDSPTGSLEQEAKRASSLGNEHILQVLDACVLPSGAWCMVTELLVGETLDNRLQRVGKLSEKELGPLLIQALDGLGAAHRAGIIHRDLTPARLFIGRDPSKTTDSVKILGFGIPNSLTSAETATAGAVAGSAGLSEPYLYLSPEQALEHEADRRSNLYSLGVIAYRSLTGKVPIFAQDLQEFLAKVRADGSRPRLTDELDGELAEIIDLAMARVPEARFQTAQAMMVAIKNWAESAGMPLELPSSEPKKQPTPPDSVEQRPKEVSGAQPTKTQASRAVAKLPPPIPVGTPSTQPPPPAPPAVASQPPPLPRSVTRPMSMDTRGPMVIAPAHNPVKLRLEEEPEALVVIQDGTDQNGSPNSSQPHTVDSAPAAILIGPERAGLGAGWTRSRKAWLTVALLLGLLGAGTVLAKLGRTPARPSSLEGSPRPGRGAGLVSKTRAAASGQASTRPAEKAIEEYSEEDDAEASSIIDATSLPSELDDAASSSSRAAKNKKKAKANRKSTTSRNPYDYR
jgi:serine/threonine-protein kinase